MNLMMYMVMITLSLTTQDRILLPAGKIICMIFFLILVNSIIVNFITVHY